MQRRRLAIALAAVLAAGATTVVAVRSGQADAAGATVYTRTVVGTDFRPLDFRVFAQFAAGTGGGVYTHVAAGNIPAAVYLEAPVDLPVGASIVNTTFLYDDCGFPDPLAKFYFGAYNPAPASYTELQPEASGNSSGTCSLEYTFTRPLKPKPVVKVGYRYILGVHSFSSSTGATPPAEGPAWVLSGAKVRFTCPAEGCSP
jgi:hypothetical protein